MKKFIKLSVVLGSVLPTFAFAQSMAGQTVGGLIDIVHFLLRLVIPVLITLAVVFFIWGVVGYMMAKDDDQKKKFKSRILNGLIGLLIIVAFWGIIALVLRTVQVDTGPQGMDVVPCTPVYDVSGNLLQGC